MRVCCTAWERMVAELPVHFESGAIHPSFAAQRLRGATGLRLSIEINATRNAAGRLTAVWRDFKNIFASAQESSASRTGSVWARCFRVLPNLRFLFIPRISSVSDADVQLLSSVVTLKLGEMDGDWCSDALQGNFCIPQWLTDYAFRDCHALRDLSLQGQFLSDAAFASLSGLTALEIPFCN